MDQSDLAVEHETLKRQVEALRREHEGLEGRPFSRAEHEAHKAQLRFKIAELRAHLARLKALTP